MVKCADGVAKSVTRMLSMLNNLLQGDDFESRNFCKRVKLLLVEKFHRLTGKEIDLHLLKK